MKRAVKRVASRAWQSIQGGHLDGHREPEHYVEQTMREVQSKLDDAGEKGKDEAK
jgi:3-dehydroquinate dehydratase